VDNAVEDGVGQGGIRNAEMPVSHRDLAGEEGRGMPKAIVEDFEQILGIGDGDGVAHPVVEDEQAIPDSPVLCKADMRAAEISKFFKLDESGESLIRAEMSQMQFSARGHHCNTGRG
jgi:hypothetical protein